MTAIREAVGIVGAGRWGTVLAHTIGSSGKSVVLLSRDSAHAEEMRQSRRNEGALPEVTEINANVDIVDDYAEVAGRCQIILLCLAVADVRAALKDLGAHLDGSHVIVHAVRGLEAGSFATPSEIIEQETCVRKIGALHGPALADEILAGHPSAAVVGSRYSEVVRLTRDALVSPSMRIYSNADLLGVEAASSAVNIIGVAVGIQKQLELGPATKAILVTRGVAEVSRLCAAVGGKVETAFGMSGLGDLLVIAERDTPEVMAGRKLAQGRTFAEITEELGDLEVMKSAQTFHEMAKERGVDAHITAAVHDMIHAGLAPAEALFRLMTVGQMAE